MAAREAWAVRGDEHGTAGAARRPREAEPMPEAVDLDFDEAAPRQAEAGTA